MKKIATEIHYRLDDGSKVFQKIIHASGEKMWFVMDVSLKNYRPANKSEVQEFESFVESEKS